MKRLLPAVVAIASFVASPAFAADTSSAAASHDWNSCYFGTNVGAETLSRSGSVDVPAATGAGGASPASSFPLIKQSDVPVAVGGQFGCSYQIVNYVFGLEGDADYHDFSIRQGIVSTPPPLFVAGDTFSVSSNWEGSIRGRAGIVRGPSLMYLTAGVAWTTLRVDTDFIAVGVFPADVISVRKTVWGPTVGLGWEYPLWDNLNLAVEGRYSWYGSQRYNSGQLATFTNAGAFTFAPATTRTNLNAMAVTVRLNWQLDWAPWR